MYVTKSLWNTDELTFIQSDGSEGYFDEHRNWIEGAPETVTVEGSLQPFETTSARQLTLPDGIKLSDARLFYTKDLREIKTADEFGNDLAAETLIGNRTFYVDQKGDWSRVGTYLRHYSYLLVRRGHNPRIEDT